jgi:plasmid replication initiation protein
VLEPAIKELAVKDNLIIQCEQQRSGRKVIGLEFKFKADPQGRLPLEG